jgi:branched-chain amino acid transport system substrate-binding protein
MKRSVRTVPIVLAGALLLAACGSSGKTTSPTTSGTSGTTASGSSPTGTPIKLMSVMAVHGGGGVSAHGEAAAGAQAAALAINASGGVNGHPIQVTVCDTQGDPNIGRNCYNKAVSGGYVAVVAEVNTNGLNILQAGNVPSVGDFGVTSEELTNPISYPILAPAALGISLLPSALKTAGATKVAAAITDVPQAAALGPLLKGVAQKVGVGYNQVMVPIATTDYSTVVQPMQSAHDDGVVLSTSDVQGSGILQAANQLGYHPKLATVDGVFTPAEIQKIGAVTNGMIVLSPTPSPFETTNPGIAMFNQQMDSAAKSNVQMTNIRDTTAIGGWLAVYGVANIVKTMTGPITGQTLIAALNTATNVSMEGAVPAWNPSKPLNTGPFLRVTSGTIFQNVVKNGLIESSGLPPLNGLG